jgi:hypothetical protein
MFSKQISLSPDIIQLRNDGYEVEIKENFLLIHNIPYFNTDKQVCKGILISKLSIKGNQVIHTKDHTTFFKGSEPCDAKGIPIRSIINNSRLQKLSANISANHLFSSKPNGGYRNYYHKMESYISMISNHVESVYANQTAKTFRVLKDAECNSPFAYVDTSSIRADILAINNKLSGLKVGIIGLGGTGSYILDMVSKTHVNQIHIFDGDVFNQHNAFRSPSAAPIEILNKNVKKVDYYKNLFGNIHLGISAHGNYITKSNLDLLKDLDFVFIAIDRGTIKKLIFNFLEDIGIRFIDCGIGVINKNDSLLASVRTNSSIEGFRDHLWTNKISFEDEDDQENIYSSNIQLCELNIMSACLAVLKWKQLYGVYHDLDNAYSSVYNSSVNEIINEDVRN